MVYVGRAGIQDHFMVKIFEDGKELYFDSEGIFTEDEVRKIQKDELYGFIKDASEVCFTEWNDSMSINEELVRDEEVEERLKPIFMEAFNIADKIPSVVESEAEEMEAKTTKNKQGV